MTMANLKPKTYQELKDFAELAAKSTIIPKQYQNKPHDIMLIIQMGADIGLAPMQSLQNIAIMNGKPSLYGDAALALVRRHPEFENIREYIEDNVAFCEIKRKNQDWYVGKFSVEDAKKAGLWGRAGPWKLYSERMLKMRARGFALRDVFADALNGLITIEEANDYPVEQETESQPNNGSEQLTEKLEEKTETKKSRPNNVEIVEEKMKLDERLFRLLKEKEIPTETQEKWLEKAGVTSFRDLPVDRVQTLLYKLESNEL
jgi:hypothetical protein